VTFQDVRNMMAASQDMQEWSKNCEKIKELMPSHPRWWHREIVNSGIYAAAMERFGAEMEPDAAPPSPAKPVEVAKTPRRQAVSATLFGNKGNS